MEIIKIKINISHIKWVLVCILLLGNLLLLAPNDDLVFIVIYEISINTLIILFFVLLTIFPKRYYIFDENGISYQNRKGKEYVYIPYSSITNISYVYVYGIIRDGMEVAWKDKYEEKNITLVLSPKQARKICNEVEPLRRLTKAS